MSSSSSSRISIGHLRRHDGFTLLELMIALTLGLLLSIGITYLFQTTSGTSKMVNGFAQLQENGRFATNQMNADLRMAGAPFCSGSSGPATITAGNGAMDTSIATLIYAGGLTLPDLPSGVSAGAPTGWPTNWQTTAPYNYPLSPSIDIKGYECDKGTTTCAPPAGATGLPAVGTTAGSRVAGADVLTVRYLQGPGWGLKSSTAGAGTCTITFGGDTGDPAFNFSSGGANLFVGVCGNPIVAATTGAVTAGANASATLSVGAAGGNSAGCSGWQPNIVRVYNYTSDYVTVTYYLRYDPDPNAPGRLISSLYRRFNGSSATSGIDSVLVQGVEKLDFLYGVSDINGNVSYFTADLVDSGSTAANCSAAPVQFQNVTGSVEQNGCLWRSIKSIEVHMLMNTVNNVYTLGSDEIPYCYSIDPTTSLATVDCTQMASLTTPPATDAAGKPSRMMRREFVSLVGVRRGGQ
ncbi:MAG: PilW family protein [Rudaea sp.]|uniref:PilW family protein n=1 Tax=unclassified Rudaea TaxID=2627037 RepID=UPI0010F969DA|nr:MULTISPECIES: PilW family protein [unclassified Rudaea]MBN8886705.1 PilW family protein [Rudaea sp.]MBR0346682.1 PilW family protein [Rudaea sp.]